MYMQGLGLRRIAEFKDHNGFDGVMLERPGFGFHFEFTHCRHSPVSPAPTAEDLIVFYVPSAEHWMTRCEAMLDAGFLEVDSYNPHWSQRGRTFQDPDGYRIVIEHASWRGEGEA